MSREIRKVPKDWVHPTKSGKYSDGTIRYTPLFDGATFKRNVTDWDEEKADWDRGEYPTYASAESKKLPYEEWNGERPNPARYMPVWGEEEKTHLMLYETTTEGTPSSPAFATAEELARWLTDNNATTFGYATTSYENWLAFCKQEAAVAVGFVVTSNGKFVSGVDLAVKPKTGTTPAVVVNDSAVRSRIVCIPDAQEYLVNGPRPELWVISAGVKWSYKGQERITVVAAWGPTGIALGPKEEKIMYALLERNRSVKAISVCLRLSTPTVSLESACAKAKQLRLH